MASGGSDDSGGGGGQQWRHHIYSSKTLDLSSLFIKLLRMNIPKMFAWRSVLPLIVVSILFIYEERVSTPSCEVIPNNVAEYEEDNLEDLKVMMVANLLLLGSDAGYTNVYFRDYYLSKFFKIGMEIPPSIRGQYVEFKQSWSGVLNWLGFMTWILVLGFRLYQSWCNWL